ncbi:hypothetical protein ACFQY4_24775 [Catellatospora bangladeshensis]
MSLSNVFSGDAPVSLLTMSTVARKGRGAARPGRSARIWWTRSG